MFNALAWRFLSRLLSLQPLIARLIGSLMFSSKAGPAKNEKIELAAVKRVLVVRLDHIGDMVLFTPFLRELRKLLPEAHITLVVQPAVQNLMEPCPYIDELLTCVNVKNRYLRPLLLPGHVLWMAVRSLRKRRFDLALHPRWGIDSEYGTFLGFFSGARWRIGYSESVTPDKQRVNTGFDRLLTHVLHDTAIKHETLHNLEVLQYLGAEITDSHLELWINDADKAFADRMFAEHAVEPQHRVVTLGLSGGHSELKQWPLSHFLTLAQWLVSHYSCRILIVGGAKDQELGRQIESSLGAVVINVAGKTTLRQMAALLSRCQAYVGNDYGPTHIASATGIPVIALFGSSCWHCFSPRGKNSVLITLDLACSPCHQGHGYDRCRRCIFDKPMCLHDITVDQVKRRLERALAGH